MRCRFGGRGKGSYDIAAAWLGGSEDFRVLVHDEGEGGGENRRSHSMPLERRFLVMAFPFLLLPCLLNGILESITCPK